MMQRGVHKGPDCKQERRDIRYLIIAVLDN
jgi:hypothetical protein